ncbi:unnamed protein product [Lota lota]
MNRPYLNTPARCTMGQVDNQQASWGGSMPESHSVRSTRPDHLLRPPYPNAGPYGRRHPSLWCPSANTWKVQTHLENSKFLHHQQQQPPQGQQVKQYLTLGGSKMAASAAMPHPHTANQPMTAVPILRSGQRMLSALSDGSNPNSPVTLLTLADHDSEFPMDEVIDDLISLESGFNDDGLDCMESNLMMQSNMSLSGSMLDLYGGEQGMKAPKGGMSPTSTNPSSTKRTVKREFTEPGTRVTAKERQKKDNHNLIERRRRYNINYRIKELGTLIPKSNDPDMRWNKGTILKASVEYIKWLQKEQHHARELDGRQKKMEQANRRLLLRIQELEIQARANGLANMSAGMATVELSSLLLKQQQQQQQQHQQQEQQQPPPLYQDDMNAEYLQHGLASLGTMPLSSSSSSSSSSSAVVNGDGPVTSFSDPLSHFTDFFGTTLKEEEHQRLDEILMDDALSPFGGDPLLSSRSPAAHAHGSKDGSLRSSLSSAEDDEDL